jgi:hypothetical protein
MTRIRPWDRVLWGVTMRNVRLDERHTLLGRGWITGTLPAAYAGEASRCGLFTTRAAARAWCRLQHQKYRDNYHDGHTCRDWRFVPIHVRERVSVIPAGAEGR